MAAVQLTASEVAMLEATKGWGKELVAKAAGAMGAAELVVVVMAAAGQGVVGQVVDLVAVGV